MKHLNLILIILILSCCPLHPAYAFFDKDIRLLNVFACCRTHKQVWLNRVSKQMSWT